MTSWSGVRCSMKYLTEQFHSSWRVAPQEIDFLHKTPNWIKLVDLGSDGPHTEHTEISNSALEYDLIAFSTAPPERLPGSILRRLYVVHLL
jgi:hypothetical protein